MSITDVSGFCISAKARVGSNGNVSGAAECLTGKATDVATGRKTWDSNLADGLDSGWVSVLLTLDASGVKWEVNGASPTHIDYSASWGEILSVTLQAAVDGANRKGSLRNVKIEFFTNSSDTVAGEIFDLDAATAPVANTMGLSNPIDAEQIAGFGPDGSGYKKLRVTAQVRLESTGTNLPGSEAIFAAIYVFTNTCS
jgi:hypothetical protein